MNDLSTRLLLSQTTGKHIVALNRRLDELEEIISIDGLAQDEDRAPADEGHGLSGIAERLEQRKKYSEQSPLALHPSESEAESTRLPEVIDETSQLLLRVGEAMKQLQRRQEEIKELHDHAVNTIEIATEQARRAEAQNEDLANDLMDDEAELNYLKLKLRILEIHTLPHVPQGDYDGLAVGIRRWKADWGEVHRRQSRRRWERGLDRQEGSPPWILEGRKGTTIE
ncbi:MAG: hypothetical protein LQ343_000437 [Gyalolechia ehrenbergii]|nr:MAG: hypothetical protein LQ343_000437 [Gyalolechia ehrenbergii]